MSSWKLWYDEGPPRGQKVEDYQREAIELDSFTSFSNYEEFWQQRLGVKEIIFPEFSNIRLFKPNIKPIWEDPANDGGGKLVIRIREPPPEPASRLWQKLLQLAWADELHDADDVCGLVLSLRPKGHMISIWNKKSEDLEHIDAMTKHYKTALGLTRSTVQYQWHKESEQRNSMANRDSRRSSDAKRRSKMSARQSSNAERSSLGSNPERPSPRPSEENESQQGDGEGVGWVMVDKTKGKKVIAATTVDEPLQRRKEKEAAHKLKEDLVAAPSWRNQSSDDFSSFDKRGSNGSRPTEERWRPMPAEKPNVNLAPTNPWANATSSDVSAPSTSGELSSTEGRSCDDKSVEDTNSVTLQATNPWQVADKPERKDPWQKEAQGTKQSKAFHERDVWQGPNPDIPVPRPKGQPAPPAAQAAAPDSAQPPQEEKTQKADKGGQAPPQPAADKSGKVAKKDKPTTSTGFVLPIPKPKPKPKSEAKPDPHEPATPPPAGQSPSLSPCDSEGFDDSEFNQIFAAQEKKASVETPDELLGEVNVGEAPPAELTAQVSTREDAKASVQVSQPEPDLASGQEEEKEEEEGEEEEKEEEDTASVQQQQQQQRKSRPSKNQKGKKEPAKEKRKKKKGGGAATSKAEQAQLSMEQIGKYSFGVMMLLLWLLSAYSWITSNR